MKGYYRRKFLYHTQDGVAHGLAILKESQYVSEAILAAICEAAAAPDAIGLLTLLNSPEVWRLFWHCPITIAGALCFRLEFCHQSC